MIDENPDEGHDELDTALMALVLPAHVEDLVYTGTAAFSGTGNDLANGIAGGILSDTLDGGLGNDTLYGLAGADRFQFTSALGAGNLDVIDDFATGLDKLVLQNDGAGMFNALAAGVLAATAFKNLGLGAVDGDDRVLYDPSTRTLFYDPDGSGVGAAIAFAVLTPGTAAPVASDLVVI